MFAAGLVWSLANPVTVTVPVCPARSRVAAAAARAARPRGSSTADPTPNRTIPASPAVALVIWCAVTAPPPTDATPAARPDPAEVTDGTGDAGAVDGAAVIDGGAGVEVWEVEDSGAITAACDGELLAAAPAVLVPWWRRANHRINAASSASRSSSHSRPSPRRRAPPTATAPVLDPPPAPLPAAVAPERAPVRAPAARPRPCAVRGCLSP